MNMKKVMTLAALTAAGAASAVVTTANTLCRIEVNSGTKSTIVAVPLVKVGDGTAIPVTQLVLTDNLTTGDTMLHWNGSSWDAWIIAKDQEGPKYWKPTVISEGSKNSKSAPAEGTALARGDAIWVNRAVETGSFYIYGQVATDDDEPSVTIAEGAPESPAYTMLGNPKTEDFDVNDFTFSATPDPADRMVFAAPGTNLGWGELSYKDGSWGFDEITTETKNGRTVTKVERKTKMIPAGCGVWYVRKSSDDLTVKLPKTEAK